MALTKAKPAANEAEIGLTPAARKEVAQLLKESLANTYSLQLKTQYYHWNVTGPTFSSLHALFASQYEELSSAVDELAERIRTLGHTTPGTFHEFAALSSLKEDKYPPSDWKAMVANLLAAHEALTRRVRDKITAAQKNGDEGTADLFIGKLQAHEKAAWMLRSHLQ
jgi:starvation-inducible DNA-binding protein